jgi:ElaA protein
MGAEYDAAMEWHCRRFDALGRDELYGILQLRVEVFVVEQRCPYQELDGKDQVALHIFASDGKRIVATARVLPPGERDGRDAAWIGRVVTAAAVRGSGVGKELMTRALAAVREHFGDVAVRLNAQKQVSPFYAAFGFTVDGDEFLEDDIPHVPMAREGSTR